LQIPTAISIYNGSVTVSGDALIETTGNGGVAIESRNADVTIDGGQVSASGSTLSYSLRAGTIYLYGQGIVTINNGLVTATDGLAIGTPRYMYPTTIFINGGEIRATDLGGICIRTDGNVEISGGYVIAELPGYVIDAGRNITITGGLVEGAAESGNTIIRAGGSFLMEGGLVATSDGSSAIFAVNQLTVKGGTIISRRGIALQSLNGPIDMSGGTVFAYGSSLDDVIYSTGDQAFAGPTGTAMVFAYSQSVATSYEQNSTIDILVWPARSSTMDAFWGRSTTGGHGISYVSNDGIGFIEILGITIIGPTLPDFPYSNVEIDGLLHRLTLEAPPMLIDGQVIAPFRVLSNALGFEATWYSDTQSLQLTKAGYTIIMTAGNAFCTVNGARFDLDMAMQYVNDRVYIPLNIFRSIGYTLQWDNERVTLVVTSPPNTFEPIAISYHANGGTGTMQSSIVLRGADHVVEANAFIRANNNFAGWNTAVDGTGTAYAAGATISSIQSSIALYAQWTVTTSGFVGGGGGGGGGGSATTSVPVGNGAISLSATLMGATLNLDLPSEKAEEIIGSTVGKTTSIDLSRLASVTDATLPKAALAQLAEAGLAIELKMARGTIAFDPAAAKFAASQTGSSSVTASMKAVALESLTEAQQAAVKQGDLVYSITVASGTQTIRSFGGMLTVSVPYEGVLPAAVWHLGDSGALENQANCCFTERYAKGNHHPSFFAA
jgi:hypothetical protein